jgi:hypothetical protein
MPPFLTFCNDSVQFVKKLFFNLSDFERERGTFLHFYASSALQRNGNNHNTRGFRRFSFHFDTLTEIRVDHPVLLGMQGDTDNPHCEVQNQGSLERRLLAVDQVARRPHH